MKRTATVILLTMLLTVIAITAHKKQIKTVSTTTIEGVVKTIETETITKTTTETTKTTTTAQSKTETTTKATTYITETKEPKSSHFDESVSISPSEFRQAGVIYSNGIKYTWYSERILPGKGLDIPGRWSDGNYVRDGDGYIVLASCDYPKGTVIQTPFGAGKVYDYCPRSGVIDVYVSW